MTSQQQGAGGKLVAGRELKGAVHRNRLMSKAGLLERLFTMAFKGLVYPQIWEDPSVDVEGLEITPDCHVLTIASGGCNVLSYLTADPKRITAVDLNRAHVALTRLKLCAARTLPDHDAFYRFLGEADDRANIKAYDRHVRPELDAASRAYWEARDLFGRRRIGMFSRNFYRFGLLGRFIGASHLVARLYGKNPRALLSAASLEEQRSIFDNVIAPLFGKRLVRWCVNRPVTLYGLGIPPAQYEALATSGGHRDMASVLLGRLERLACDFALEDNYFAWQAFGRSYRSGGPGGPVPPYLRHSCYDVIRERIDRVAVEQVSFTKFLERQPDASVDRYVLLDAQDWMTDADLNALWREITRTARPGARVIFRTAAEPSLLPGRVADEVLDRWSYEEERSQELGRRDRSSIYGGVHLYVAKGQAS